MYCKISLFFKVVMLVTLLTLFSVHAQEKKNVPIYINSKFGSFVIRPKIKSSIEIKSKNVIMQKLDFSCGSAATATIFNYYLNDSLTEEEVIKGLFHFGNKQKIIENKGFSLLDIKKLSNALGYKVNGYKTDIEGLLELNKPCIVTITLGDYKHFVIFRGVYNHRVYLADPALGNTTLSISEFNNMWYKKIALVIEPKNGNYTNKLAILEKDQLTFKNTLLRNILRNPYTYTYKTNIDH